MKTWIAFVLIAAGCGFQATAAESIGNLSNNPFGANSTSNPYSPAGSIYSPTSIKNPYGSYGSRYSNQSATNPYATDAPKLFDEHGNYRGKLSSNPYDADSTSNPHGRYGSKYSPESINNPYGAGSPYRSDSPTNPYGTGLQIRPRGNGSSIRSMQMMQIEPIKHQLLLWEEDE